MLRFVRKWLLLIAALCYVAGFVLDNLVPGGVVAGPVMAAIAAVTAIVVLGNRVVRALIAWSADGHRRSIYRSKS